MSLTVVGLGSELSGDDAIGLVLVQRLRRRLAGLAIDCTLWPDADAFTVAHELLALATPVLLVDCAELELPPGSHLLLAREGVKLRVKQGPVSLHGIGLAEGLELARRLGFEQAVHLFAVQPCSLTPATPLSGALEARLPALTGALEQAARAISGAEPARAGGGA